MTETDGKQIVEPSPEAIGAADIISDVIDSLFVNDNDRCEISVEPDGSQFIQGRCCRAHFIMVVDRLGQLESIEVRLPTDLEDNVSFVADVRRMRRHSARS